MGARVAPPIAGAQADECIRRRAVRKRWIYVAVAAALAVLGGAVASSAVAGQEASGDAEVRIVARKLESGRIEFGLQQRQTDNTWGDRQLPHVRFFPTPARVASSPLTLRVAQTAPESTTQQTRDTFSAIAAGIFHSCGLRTDGTITCWGANDSGQADGTIVCWGNLRLRRPAPWNLPLTNRYGDRETRTRGWGLATQPIATSTIWRLPPVPAVAMAARASGMPSSGTVGPISDRRSRRPDS